MLEPMEKAFTLADGTTKTYVLTKFPAIAGREIVTQYPTTGIPKIGEYKQNEQVMLKLMCFVGVPMDNGTVLMLNSPALVNNHCPDFEVLMKIEWAMMEYNCSFFRNGAASGLLTNLSDKVRSLITKTLMDLSRSSSQTGKQP